MPYIQLNDKQFPLRVGETSVGTAGADVPVDGPAALGVQARLQLGADNSVVIRRASSEAAVRVNGVLLGVEPTPLIHGDKIEVAGNELLYGDDRKGGQTQYLGGLNVAELVEGARATGAAKPTGTTGGRLVSLVDGREYAIGATGIAIGRDAGCDVVVPSPEVSRKHAEILPGSAGYTVADLSTNGIFVNGQRVPKAQTLARGDVLRVGTEEFRFYADVAQPAPAAPAAAAAPVAAPTAPPAAPAAPVPAVPATPAMAAAASLTPVASPVTPAAPTSAEARAPLATLEVMNEGPLKGARFDLRVPLVHVGRGAHNDIVLADDSVSDSHAKLQKREAGWYVVDMGSTNGTWVGGQRINGEASLGAHSSVRFGKIRVTFDPAAEPRDASHGTRVIAGLNAEQVRKMSREAEAVDPVEPPAKSGLPGWVWLLVLVLVAAGAFFILKVR